MEQSKVAIYVDVENLTKWVKEDGLEKLITDLSGTSGRIVTRKAYGVWSNAHISNLQAPLNRLGFDLVHSFHPVGGKNSADIQLTMDVLESAIRVDDIEHIVLATGDSDFSPLFRRLREMGKKVIGVGPRSPLSECVKSSCTRYIYTDIAEEIKAQYELSEAVAMIEKLLDEHGEPMGLGPLKNQLISMDNAFDERNWGYANFSAFVREIQTVDIFQEGEKTNWLACIKKVIIPKEDSTKLQTASTEFYRKILRGMKWPFIPRSLVDALHESLENTKSMEASEMKENLIQLVSTKHRRKLMVGSTSGDLRKGLNLLLKAQLFDVTFDDNDEKYWIYKGDANYISEINKAMIERVQSGCGKERFVYDLKLVQPLLYLDK